MKAYRLQEFRVEVAPHSRDAYEGKVSKKNVIVQIETNRRTKELYEFDTAKECAEFLGLTEEQVRIMGVEHLVLKRGNGQKVRVSCDDLTAIRMKRKERKRVHNFPYHSDKRTIWIKLEEPIFGYTELGSSGVLRKETPNGNWQRKQWVFIDGEQAFGFVSDDPLVGFEIVKTESLFKKYVNAFDEAFRKKEEERDAKYKAKV